MATKDIGRDRRVASTHCKLIISFWFLPPQVLFMGMAQDTNQYGFLPSETYNGFTTISMNIVTFPNNIYHCPRFLTAIHPFTSDQ